MLTLMKLGRTVAAGLMGLTLTGCRPAEPPPPDVLLHTQRDALNKARAVEGALQEQADAQRKAIEEAQK